MENEEYTSPLLIAVEMEMAEAANNKGDRPRPITVSHHVANINNKIHAMWEIRPVEAAKNKYGFIGTFRELKRAPMRLMLVLDVSHSMAEPFGELDGKVSKLEKMKTFAALLVKEISEEDFLGIVTFGTKAKVIHPMVRMHSYHKEKALEAIEATEVGGVTNLSQGLFLAVDQFVVDYRMITVSKHLDDNLLLFTDGMANEGITDTGDLIIAVQKKINKLKKTYNYEDDYAIRFTTLGTGGFLPQTIYELGQAFGSDAFHLIDEKTSLELSMFRPVFLKLLNNAHRVKIKITALNGVTFDKTVLDSEYSVKDIEDIYDTDSEDENKSPPPSPKTPSPKHKNKKNNKKSPKKKKKKAPTEEEKKEDDVLEFYFHDMCKELQRHLTVVLILPKRHKRVLKEKEVVKLEINSRDVQFHEDHLEDVIMYEDLPLNATDNAEASVVAVAQQQNRNLAVKSLDKSATCVLKLDRINAREALASGVNEIQDNTDNISNLLTSEETFEVLTDYTQPIISNLEHCEKLIDDYNVKWDDAWARMKALSSCLSRETPTATGVCADGAELFETREIQKRMGNICAVLREVYKSKGMDTSNIDKYQDVVKELEARWEASKDYIPDPEPVMVFNFKLE